MNMKGIEYARDLQDYAGATYEHASDFCEYAGDL